MFPDVSKSARLCWLALSQSAFHAQTLAARAKSMMLPAGADNGSCVVVMSKGTRWQQQSYKVDDKFPYEWIKKKWAEKFAVTSIASCSNNGEPQS